MRLFIICCLLLSPVINSVLASSPLAISISADLFDKYLWRGQNLHDGFALQPGAELESGAFTAGLWGTQNFGDQPSAGFSELDVYGSYSLTCPLVKKASLDLGAIAYIVPESMNDFKSGYFFESTLSYSLDYLTAPSLSYSLDEDLAQYLDLGFSHDLELPKSFSLTAFLNSGLSVSKNWDFTPTVTVPSVCVTYSTVVDISLTMSGQVPLHDSYESDYLIGLGVSYSLGSD